MLGVRGGGGGGQGGGRGGKEEGRGRGGKGTSAHCPWFLLTVNPTCAGGGGDRGACTGDRGAFARGIEAPAQGGWRSLHWVWKSLYKGQIILHWG